MELEKTWVLKRKPGFLGGGGWGLILFLIFICKSKYSDKQLTASCETKDLKCYLNRDLFKMCWYRLAIWSGWTEPVLTCIVQEMEGWGLTTADSALLSSEGTTPTKCLLEVAEKKKNTKMGWSWYFRKWYTETRMHCNQIISAKIENNQNPHPKMSQGESLL